MPALDSTVERGTVAELGVCHNSGASVELGGRGSAEQGVPAAEPAAEPPAETAAEPELEQARLLEFWRWRDRGGPNV